MSGLLFNRFLAASDPPCVGESQSRNDMPYTPPCSDYDHTAVVCPDFRIEDVRIEKKNETQAGILDAGFDSECSSVFIRSLEQASGSETDAECKKIMYKNDKEDVLDALHEGINVVSESDHPHDDEESH